MQSAENEPKNLKEQPEYNVFMTVMLYSIAILLLPILAFFLTKNFIFDGILSMSVISSNVWSAVCAVLVLHLCLGSFIYKAYFEAAKVEKQD